MSRSVEAVDHRAGKRDADITRRSTFRTLAKFAVFGLIANVGLTLLLSLTIRPFEAESAALSTMLGGDERWTVTRFEGSATTAVVSDISAAVSWSHRQACGPPDTPTAGDQVTAWAPSTPDGDVEWLEVDFARAVVPSQVRVVQTYNPGGVCKVEVYDPQGVLSTAWEGQDPTPPGSGMGTSDVPLKVTFPVRTVRIWIDSPNVPGWNEIDAVGLVGPTGDVQWAVRSRASSFYGQSSLSAAAPTAPIGPSPASLVPTFGGLEQVQSPAAGDAIHLERRVLVGFGWPMRSLWKELDATSGPASANATVAASAFTFPAPAAMPVVPTTATALPYRLVWPGFLVNTLLFTVTAMLMAWLVVRPGRFIAELARIRRGACLECGYDLGYDFVKGCPECGWRRDDRDSRPTLSDRPPTPE